MIQTSWGKYEDMDAWSLTALYDKLWQTYKKKITDFNIDRDFLDSVERMDFDIMVSTIPAPCLCLDPDEHFFDSHKFWVYEVPSEGMGNLGGNVVIYNGEQGTPWYRSSRLFGKSYIEFGDNSIHPDGCVPAAKIIATNCDCRPDWLKTGRFGRWERGVLVHDAYWETKNAMLKLFGSGTTRSSN
jgi:hypothetical protein